MFVLYENVFLYIYFFQEFLIIIERDLFIYLLLLLTQISFIHKYHSFGVVKPHCILQPVLK